MNSLSSLDPIIGININKTMIVANIYRNHIHIPPLLKNTHRGPGDTDAVDRTISYNPVCTGKRQIDNSSGERDGSSRVEHGRPRVKRLQ